jgi:hypothetical protein
MNPTDPGLTPLQRKARHRGASKAIDSQTQANNSASSDDLWGGVPKAKFNPNNHPQRPRPLFYIQSVNVVQCHAF